MKCNVVKLSGQLLLAGLVVSLQSLSILEASAQDFSDPATIIMMNAQRRGLVPANTATPALPQDFAEPADIIMMNAQRRGLIPAGQAVPSVRPAAASPSSESTSFTGHSHGPFDGAPGSSSGPSPFAQPSGAVSGGNSSTMGARTNGMSAQQIFDRGCDKTAAGNFAEAIKDYDEAIKVDPNFGKAYANRGSAKYNTGDHKGALADFEVAAKLMPENQAVSALRDQIRNSVR